MIHQIQSKKLAGAAFMLIIITVKKKDQFLTNQKNYQRIEPKEKAAEYLATPELGDLLTVQKVAATSPTALVGKDTDPIFLFCYHAVLIPMTSSFILS